jgi:hypothetical protein
MALHRFAWIWARVFALPVGRSGRLPSILFALIQLGSPCAALADDIYQWTDERGRSVLSNVAPAANDKARNVKLLVKGSKPAATGGSPTAPVPEAPRAEQAPAVENSTAPVPAASPAPAGSPAERVSGNAPATKDEPPSSRPRRQRSSDPD